MNEVNLTGLMETPTKILTDKVSKYIDSYTKAKGCLPEDVHLTAGQWDKLELAFKSKKRELNGHTFMGVKLLRAKS